MEVIIGGFGAFLIFMWIFVGICDLLDKLTGKEKK